MLVERYRSDRHSATIAGSIIDMMQSLTARFLVKLGIVFLEWLECRSVEETIVFVFW